MSSISDPAVREIFAATVLPDRRYPELMNDDEKRLENSFVVPAAALASVSPALRTPAGNGRANIIAFVVWVKLTDSPGGLHPPYPGPCVDAVSGQGS